MKMPKAAKTLIVMAVLMALCGSCLFASGWPVMDVAAIFQSVRGYISDLQQYAQQIQKWKSEIEKAIQIAKSMASGDWDAVLSGVKSYCKQISSWGISSKYLDNFLNNLGDTVAMGESLAQFTKSTGGKLQDLWGSLTGSGSFSWETGFDSMTALADMGASVMANVAAIGDFGQQVRQLSMATEVMAGENGIDDLREQLTETKEEYQNILTEASEARGNDNQAEADQRMMQAQALARKIEDLTEQINVYESAQKEIKAEHEKALNAALKEISEIHEANLDPDVETQMMQEVEKNYASFANGIWAEETYVDMRKTPARLSFNFM